MEKLRKTEQPKLEPPAKAPETISNRIEWPKTESSTQIFKINFKMKTIRSRFEGPNVYSKGSESWQSTIET